MAGFGTSETEHFLPNDTVCVSLQEQSEVQRGFFSKIPFQLYSGERKLRKTDLSSSRSSSNAFYCCPLCPYSREQLKSILFVNREKWEGNPNLSKQWHSNHYRFRPLPLYVIVTWGTNEGWPYYSQPTLTGASLTHVSSTPDTINSYTEDFSRKGEFTVLISGYDHP
jgi:hypothetical protein